MTHVKICGLRTVEHAQAAVEAGASMLGFVFAPSRRQVTPEQAAQIISALAQDAQRSVRYVGLFVNETPERMLAIAEELGLDELQLSGDENASVLQQLGNRSVIKAVRLAGAPAEQPWIDAPLQAGPRLMVDAHVSGSYGGTGVVGDWDNAAKLARTRPILLAGGLTPENVGAAIRQIRPWGVDVSSGVETNGHKDSAKIRAFLEAVRDADRSLEAQ